jgi:hypothetical protein
MAMLNQVRELYDQAVENLSPETLKGAQEGIKSGASSIFEAARKNPKTTAAVILGTGLAAAALWVLREPQRLAAVRRSIESRMRDVKRLTNRKRTSADRDHPAP